MLLCRQACFGLLHRSCYGNQILERGIEACLTSGRENCLWNNNPQVFTYPCRSQVPCTCSMCEEVSRWKAIIPRIFIAAVAPRLYLLLHVVRGSSHPPHMRVQVDQRRKQVQIHVERKFCINNALVCSCFSLSFLNRIFLLHQAMRDERWLAALVCGEQPYSLPCVVS